MASATSAGDLGGMEGGENAKRDARMALRAVGFVEPHTALLDPQTKLAALALAYITRTDVFSRQAGCVLKMVLDCPGDPPRQRPGHIRNLGNEFRSVRKEIRVVADTLPTNEKIDTTKASLGAQTAYTMPETLGTYVWVQQHFVRSLFNRLTASVKPLLDRATWTCALQNMFPEWPRVLEDKFQEERLPYAAPGFVTMLQRTGCPSVEGGCWAAHASPTTVCNGWHVLLVYSHVVHDDGDIISDDQPLPAPGMENIQTFVLGEYPATPSNLVEIASLVAVTRDLWKDRVAEARALGQTKTDAALTFLGGRLRELVPMLQHKDRFPPPCGPVQAIYPAQGVSLAVSHRLVSLLAQSDGDLRAALVIGDEQLATANAGLSELLGAICNETVDAFTSPKETSNMPACTHTHPRRQVVNSILQVPHPNANTKRVVCGLEGGIDAYSKSSRTVVYLAYIYKLARLMLATRRVNRAIEFHLAKLCTILCAEGAGGGDLTRALRVVTHTTHDHTCTVTMAYVHGLYIGEVESVINAYTTSDPPDSGRVDERSNRFSVLTEKPCTNAQVLQKSEALLRSRYESTNKNLDCAVLRNLCRTLRAAMTLYQLLVTEKRDGEVIPLMRVRAGSRRVHPVFRRDVEESKSPSPQRRYKKLM